MASLPMMKRFALLSTQLYNILLRPIENLYDKNLLIATNPEFEGFPFHTIEQQDKRNNVHYAIELTSIDYIPSLQTLCYRTTGASRIQTVTALGNATGQNWALDYELRDIRSFFKYASLITGSEASWSALKTAKGDILQISVAFSQGTMEQPLGAFSLSNGRTPETLSLPFCSLSELSASPVVFLSNQYGQGVTMTSGQAHVVQMNGTADVVMTAWLADRQATKFFSEYFYTHLSNGLAPGDAYRQALLNLIKTRETNNPRSWGQFFHYGVN
jgi:CHAT domain-containing protein